MKRYLSSFTLFLCLLSAMASPATANLDSLYRAIDDAIDHADVYVARKEQRINLLRQERASARSAMLRYTLSYNLYKEYKPFVKDSAIYFLNDCVAQARLTGQQARVGECLSLMAFTCSGAGLYDEARTFLAQIDTTTLDREAFAAYYRAMYHVNSELAYYTSIAPMKANYQREAGQYAARMLRLLPHDDLVSMETRELFALNDGHLKESMAINDAWLKRVKKGSHPYALVALYRYLEHKAVGDTTKMMYWLAESVLADVRNGVMDQGSMWEMSNQLMLQGDADRSYRYITFATKCANRYGSRQRSWQISPLLSQIANQYKAASESKNHQLKLLLVVISLLSVCILLILFYVNKQRKKLAKARQDLSRKNLLLSESNDKLSAVNAEQRQLNVQLSESNRVKEEYVGRFIRLCSINIDKMDDFRKQVNRMVKNREYEQLYQMTHSRKDQEKELDALFDDFDKAFLHLFPHFIADFNSLLKPEAQVEVAEEGRMTTTLRIFALIRLGIDDSSKIAEFLHYSVNTIYNYRARTKNGALYDRDEFEEHVKALGQPKS